MAVGKSTSNNRLSLHSLASTKTAKRDPRRITTTKESRSSVHSKDDSARSSAVVDDSWPIHPIECMRGPFQESILEAMDPDARTRQTIDAATRRLQLVELDGPTEDSQPMRWRRKPGAKFHPLWKLIAQISFGIHLLNKQMAKSEEEVIRILQTHVDEIDAFLEDVGTSFDLAMRDINDRLRLLLMPMENAKIFRRMLRDREYRRLLIEGNDIVEKICSRTKGAMQKTLEDVDKGLEATAELAKFLDRLGNDWANRDEDMQVVYSAMRGNAEGWYCAFSDIVKKGEKLTKMIRRLERIVAEIEREAGIASRRNTRQKDSLMPPTSNSHSEPRSPVETSKQPSAVVSPIVSPSHSRSPSSFRSSLNKPLPPDPHRHSKMSSSHHRKPSGSQSHSAKPSKDSRSIAVELPAGSQSPVRSANFEKRASRGPEKPTSDTRAFSKRPPSVLMHIEESAEKEAQIASAVPLPHSPPVASPTRSSEAPSHPLLDISSPTELDLRNAIPSAFDPELQVPDEDIETSPATEKHLSSSIVQAYEQVKASRPTSEVQHDKSEAAPHTGSGETPSSNQQELTGAHDEEIDRAHGSPTEVSPPTLTHTGTTASQSSIQHNLESTTSPDEVQVARTEQPVTSHSARPSKDMPRGVPVRKPVARKPSGPSVPMGVEHQVATETAPVAAKEATPTLIETPAEQAGLEGEEAPQSEGKALASTKDYPSEQSFVTVNNKPEDTASPTHDVEQSMSGKSDPNLHVASTVDENRLSTSSMLQRGHSISSVGSLAQDSTIVERPQSQNVHSTTFPKRTISMQGLPAISTGFGRSDLPEIVVEPRNGSEAGASNEMTTAPSSPMTPPVPERSPERSAVRTPTRSGAKSPGPYKLMPDIESPPPTETEPLSPRTALPQFTRPEPQKRFRKPSMTMFKGMLSKKNVRQTGAGGLGGHVAMV